MVSCSCLLSAVNDEAVGRTRETDFGPLLKSPLQKLDIESKFTAYCFPLACFFIETRGRKSGRMLTHLGASKAPMNTVQGILPGLEVYFVEPAPYTWKPRPGMLARVKSYFEGYLRNGRDIYARRKHIAEKLGCSIRTLARYIAWLTAEGWIETIKRTARTAIRKVLSVQLKSTITVPPSDPRIEVNPHGTKVLRQQMFTPSVIWVSPSNQVRDSKRTDQAKPEAPLMPEGLGFEAYRRLRQKLRDSLPWIEKALNRRAYERAIVKQELALMGVA